ncbi:MAG: hypothetical protein MJ182_08120 [Treponema sp.]|nr:hypothetical protein [Treponema sp.]
MFTFSLLLFPLALGIYFAETKKKSDVILVITGSLTAFLIFALKEFLTLSHRIIPLSLGINFSYLFFRETFIPIVLLYGVFWILSKDSAEYKFLGFFPLVASFFTVFLPYNVITSPEAKTAFEILAKPVLYLSMIMNLARGFQLINSSLSSKKVFPVIHGSLIIAFSILLPAMAEALFLSDFPWYSYIILILLSLFITICGKILKKNT